jgi:serine/threonine protein kinase
VGFSVENICGFLIRSRLMTAEEMRAMVQRWKAEAGASAAQVPSFLMWLVSAGYVTEYQANLLGQGHADDFFLNQYKILERIGRGRMAGVFRAVHSLGQVVAIKVLPPSRAKEPQVLARFQREARLALRLKHPHIVRSFQVGEANGLHYLVMEHLEGETLDDLLRRRKRLPPAEAVRLAHQTLMGLQHLHEQGMVHRDIKPANLFLVGGGAASGESAGPGQDSTPTNVKILDIGLARELFDEAPPGATGPDGVQDLTTEGVLLGTPDYLAPEQARDPRRSDIRADVYSVGCVLYHMLAGQPPFPDRNLFNQIIRHATEPPRSLRSFNPAVPEGLEQIVFWMLAKQPEQRYPTPARAAQALEVYLLVGAEAPPEEPPQLRRYLTWLEAEPPPPAPAAPPAAAADQTKGAPEDTTIVPAAPVPAPTVQKAAPATVAGPAPGSGVRKVIPSPPRSGTIKKVRPVVPPAAPAPATGEIDVELVTAPPLPPRPLPATPVSPKGPAAGRSRTVLVVVAAVTLALVCVCGGAAGVIAYLYGLFGG